MCKKIVFLMTFVLAVMLASWVKAVENGRSQTRFDHFWRFEKGNIPDANQAGFDDSTWRIVSIPHDWSIEDLTRENGPFDACAVNLYDVGYTVGGTAWYRKKFSLDANDNEKKIHLQFDGIYMNSDVWVNGVHVGNRPYGYSTFWFDITDYVNFGAENVIAVEVKNEGKNSRWYSGSGIFRPVTLMIMDKVHIAHWDPYITTPVVSASSADVRVRTEVKNESDSSKTVTLQSTILDSNGVTVATDSAIFSISSAASHVFDQTITVSNLNLWSIDSPMLYILSQDVNVSGQVVDHVETNFGIRSISFNATNGFLLNGQSVLLQGSCMHHDNYMLGSAAFDRAEERRVEMTKAAGYNAIRTSHNPPSQAFLNACDRLGVLVIDEAFDMWNNCKWDHVDDYSKYFASWWQADIDSMVLRDRNHPSVVMWSIGNEIPEQGTTQGTITAQMLATYVRSLDPTRPVTLAANGSGASYDAYFATLDVVGYNYQPGSYTSEHARIPARVMFGSESFPKDAFNYWKAVEDYSYVIGDFVWTGYDYLGEASIGWTGYAPSWWGLGPYPWHLAYCGDIDACGYKRPAAYYRGVLWNTGQNKVCAFVKSPTPSLPNQDLSWNRQWVYPDIHPSWTWPGYEGASLEVTVYSECEQVELFLNDVSLGTKATSGANKCTATWNVTYAPGELKAVGYVGGVPQAQWILNTAGVPMVISLTADKSTIAADGSSLCYVTAELLEGSGNAVYDPNDDRLISFDINGPGKLAGVGNANPYGTESFQRPQRMTFRGRCVAVLKSTLKTGTITLTASSSGLTSDSVIIETTGGVTSNTAPVAYDDSYSIYSGETLDVWPYGVVSNDVDSELDLLSAVLVSGVLNGTLTLNSDGTFEYDPNDTFTGTDSFTYRASDGDANSNVAMVTIDVMAKAPMANDDYYNVVQDTVLSVAAASGVLVNDITYGGTLTAILVSKPYNGSLTLDLNGAFDYDPCAGFIGIDTFTYKANDGTYDSNITTVFIDVLDAHPIAYDDDYSAVQNTVLVVDANSGVLDNDFSPSGEPLSATVVSGPNNGSLILNPNGSFQYNPNNTFAGTDSFTYYASARGYSSNAATVRISVMAPLTMINPSFELDGSGNYITCHTSVGIGWTTVNFWVGVDIYCGAPGACVNCRSPVPPDGNCYSFMQTNNTYLYQVLADRIIEDGQYTFAFDAQTSNNGADIVPSMFYVNDSNADVEIVASTIGLSTGAWNNDLSVSFTAAAGQPYLGKKLGIKLHAPVPGDMDTNKWIFLDNVRLDMQIVGGEPVARDDYYNIFQGNVLNVDALSGVLANDYARSGSLTAILVSEPSNGSLTLNSDGSFEYTPDVDFIGKDTFTYKANDGEDDSNIATVYVDVLDPTPVAMDDNYTAAMDQTLYVVAESGVLANDDSPGGTPTAILVSPPTNGLLTLNSDGSFEYTPDTGFTGTDIFKYKANRGGYDSNVATVTINVRKLPQGIVGWWKLDDGSGITAYDSAGTNNGTLHNMDDNDWVEGYIGPSALEFDGSDDYVSVPPLGLNSNTVTMTAWIKRNGTQAESFTGIVFSRDGSTTAGLGFGSGPGWSVNHELAYNWNDSSAAWGWHSGLFVPDNQWVFISLVVEPTQATLYMNENGTLPSATNTIVHVIEEFDGVTRIGHDVHSDGRYFRGTIDDVRIYNRALSPAEIEQLFGGEPEPSELILDLADDVMALNLHKGTSNSLKAKLKAATRVLKDKNEKNDVAAINTLRAFINAVEAQRGKKIPRAEADELIASAQEIIELLSGE
jgi:beta-galactosidase